MAIVVQLSLDIERAGDGLYHWKRRLREAGKLRMFNVHSLDLEIYIEIPTDNLRSVFCPQFGL